MVFLQFQCSTIDPQERYVKLGFLHKGTLRGRDAFGLKVRWQLHVNSSALCASECSYGRDMKSNKTISCRHHTSGLYAKTHAHADTCTHVHTRAHAHARTHRCSTQSQTAHRTFIPAIRQSTHTTTKPPLGAPRPLVKTVGPRDCTVPTQYPRARHGGAYVRLGQRSLIPPYAASAPARSPLTSRPSESTSPWRRERRGSDGCRCSRCTQTCPD